jgi:hypothetical protein
VGLSTVERIRRTAQHLLELFAAPDVLGDGGVIELAVRLPVDPIIRVRFVRGAGLPKCAGREVAVVVVAVHQDADAELADVAQAHGAVRLRPRLGEHGQEDRDQYRDDADHDQQLDEREPAASLAL